MCCLTMLYFLSNGSNHKKINMLKIDPSVVHVQVYSTFCLPSFFLFSFFIYMYICFLFSDTGSFRCPICRETIHMPQGGVSAFPPSFIVNQLLDLMQQQRRDVIPKCSVHSNQVQTFIMICDWL